MLWATHKESEAGLFVGMIDASSSRGGHHTYKIEVKLEHMSGKMRVR